MTRREDRGRTSGGAPEPVAAVDGACPYCGEPVELLVDRSGGARQEYVEDCPVCCRPWAVRVELGAGGAVRLEVGTLD